MRSLLILVFLTVLLAPLTAQPYFAVHTTGAINYFDTFQDAISNSVNGDTIYAPGGNHYIGTVSIDKSLQIYGVGYFPDSCLATSETYFIGNLRILTGADGGLLCGIRLSGDLKFGTSTTNQTVNDYLISRCWIYSSLYLSYNGTNNSSSRNITIRECIIEGYFWGGYCEAALVEKSVIESRVHYFDGAVFRNNILLMQGFGNTSSSYASYQVFYYIANSFFENNIVHQVYNYTLNTNSHCTNNGFYNNIFQFSYSFPSNSNYGEGNQFSVAPASLYENVTNYYAYSIAFDYHLIPGSSGEGAGSDGTDVGIYGTSAPFKHVPVTPHIQLKSIDRQLSGDGELNVEIHISAQDR